MAAVTFTVRFKGTGYKQIQPLETSIVSTSMLGSIPVKYIAMEANDGTFVTTMYLHIALF